MIEHKKDHEHHEPRRARIDNNPDEIDFKKLKKKIKKNTWAISTVVLGVVVIILLVLNLTGMGAGFSSIPAESAGEKVVSYLNSKTGGGVEYVSAGEEGSLYRIMVSYQGQEIPVFVTKDGEYFVQGAVPMNPVLGDVTTQDNSSQPPVQEIPKSDKPKVELFIMTHCPYGTQAEKGIIPAYEALGDTIDGSIKFVHYFMHEPEEDETPIQVCIREEQSSKYLDYLKCFLEDGDSDRCIDEVKVSKAKINSCIKNKAEEYYNEDSELSEGYGVRGSPTLIVNGQIVQTGRDSASYISTICSAFNEAPEECSEELSPASPSPGFGYEVSGSAASNNAQC